MKKLLILSFIIAALNTVYADTCWGNVVKMAREHRREVIYGGITYIATLTPLPPYNRYVEAELRMGDFGRASLYFKPQRLDYKGTFEDVHGEWIEFTTYTLFEYKVVNTFDLPPNRDCK